MSNVTAPVAVNVTAPVAEAVITTSADIFNFFLRESSWVASVTALAACGVLFLTAFVMMLLSRCRSTGKSSSSNLQDNESLVGEDKPARSFTFYQVLAIFIALVIALYHFEPVLLDSGLNANQTADFSRVLYASDRGLNVTATPQNYPIKPIGQMVWVKNHTVINDKWSYASYGWVFANAIRNIGVAMILNSIMKSTEMRSVSMSSNLIAGGLAAITFLIAGVGVLYNSVALRGIFWGASILFGLITLFFILINPKKWWSGNESTKASSKLQYFIYFVGSLAVVAHLVMIGVGSTVLGVFDYNQTHLSFAILDIIVVLYISVVLVVVHFLLGSVVAVSMTEMKRKQTEAINTALYGKPK